MSGDFSQCWFYVILHTHYHCTRKAVNINFAVFHFYGSSPLYVIVRNLINVSQRYHSLWISVLVSADLTPPFFDVSFRSRIFFWLSLLLLFILSLLLLLLLFLVILLLSLILLQLVLLLFILLLLILLLLIL